MKIFLFSFLLICQGFATSCFAYQVLKSDDSYIFEVYEPFDCIEKAVLDEALVMYYEAYLNPKLHEGISLEALGIDPATFSSYDNYIADMFYTDFQSYQRPTDQKLYYFQVRHTVDSRIIGLCAVLRQAVPGHYFIDHLGIHKDFRRQGLATGLINEVVKWLDDFKEIALDTRVFNLPAQVLYESLGFQKVPYPILKKRSTYFYYILHKNM